jgi:hypothetical protein
MCNDALRSARLRFESPQPSTSTSSTGLRRSNAFAAHDLRGTTSPGLERGTDVDASCLITEKSRPAEGVGAPVSPRRTCRISLQRRPFGNRLALLPTWASAPRLAGAVAGSSIGTGEGTSLRYDSGCTLCR